MSDADDIVHLIEDADAQSPIDSASRWKVAVIDDDPAVHEGTRFALADYVLHGQRLEILSASSAAEGRALMRAHPDIAVVLLDVIMETDDAGLALVDFIRSDLKNETVRIILRTGQPGQAPERRIIVDYDINDYKAKTELTADKLFTSLTAALRSYQQLAGMVQTRRGLEVIIDAAAPLYAFRSIQHLAHGVLTQIAALIEIECAGILLLRESLGDEDRLSVLAGSGCYAPLSGADADALGRELQERVAETLRRREHAFLARWSVLYIATGSGREIVVVLDAGRQLSDTERTLIELFGSRLATAFDNVILYEQLQEANARLEERVAERTRDLTSANLRLAAQWSRLQRVNAFKNEILGTVAHDLKNPLSVIVGRTDMLQRLVDSGPFFAERVQSQIEHIRLAADRLTEMVDSLLSDAMADALDITIRREPADLTALVKEVAEANHPLAARKQQFIKVSAPSACPTSCDADRMREAIDNLLSNAIKYSPIGGRIEVALEQQADRTVLRVKDQGAGLTSEDIPRLFGRFQRLTARPTGGESSTGLGLSIVKRIVDLHGGGIVAESPGLGQGTTFTVTLPAA